MKLGETIRRIRKVKKLTIAELAKRAGVSESYISQLERDLVDPSVSLLRRLAFSLDVPLSAFFDDDIKAPVIVRLDERRRNRVPDGSVSFSRISPDSDGAKIDLADAEIAAGAHLSAPAYPNHVCLYLLNDSLWRRQYFHSAGRLF